jgi:hypothetical protein
MNSEQAIIKSLEVSTDIPLKLNKDEKKETCKVNINTLMLKVREKEKNQKKENLTFICLVSTVVVVTGIIASL